MASVFVKMEQLREPFFLIIAITVGSLTGLFSTFEAPFMDFSILALLFFLFYNLTFDKYLRGAKNRKYLSIAWVSNFVIIPSLAFIVASIFVDNSNVVFVGLIIYFVAPCTDWYLGFTKLAKGDIEVNAALLPINLLSQIVLLPAYLYVFTDRTIRIPFDSFIDVLIYWVALPFVIAQLSRFVIMRSSENLLTTSKSLADKGALFSLVLLVFSIFNANINSLIGEIHLVPIIFIVIFAFFVLTFFLMKMIADKLLLSKEEKVSLTMTTSARNAPLMLVISIGLFPQETGIQLVLIIGMLIELPHLIAITYLLKKR